MTNSTSALKEEHWRLINREHILDMAMGDVEFLAELIEFFLNSVAEQLNEIKQAINDQDPKKLSEAAHACKGAVGIYTKLAPFLLLQLLEDYGKSNHLDESLIVYYLLEKEMTQLTTEIKTLMAQECRVLS